MAGASIGVLGEHGPTEGVAMGANSYAYFTPYQRDIQAALNALRVREFEAGRDDPAVEMAAPPGCMFEFTFPPHDSVPNPGAHTPPLEGAHEPVDESGSG